MQVILGKAAPYRRLFAAQSHVFTEDIVLDMGEEDRIIGIEILDASKHVPLERLLPIKYEFSKT